ncbi:hypothetical protein AYO38_01910 [bacterium SCGC AG-212-C10]|nr:hypothetical protein AYO38_01910 [bacterium SCGC AG-212-C10]
MTHADEWRIALARDIASVAARQPGVIMAAVGGSAARGQADAWSDIDMAVYWDEVDPEFVASPWFTGAGVDRFTYVEVEPPRLYLEQYFIAAAKVDIVHIARSWLDDEFNKVTRDLDTTPDRQEVLGGLADSLPLHGEAEFARWQGRLAAYPDALAEKMVREHLRFMPGWALSEQCLVRGDLFMYHELLSTALKNVTGVLAGLNRRYVCLAKAKRIDSIVERMPIAPPDAAAAIRALLRGDDFEANYTALVGGTLALVEQHMPSINTAAAHALFAFPMPPAHEGPQVTLSPR